MLYFPEPGGQDLPEQQTRNERMPRLCGFFEPGRYAVSQCGDLPRPDILHFYSKRIDVLALRFYDDRIYHVEKDYRSRGHTIGGWTEEGNIDGSANREDGGGLTFWEYCKLEGTPEILEVVDGIAHPKHATDHQF